MATDSLFATVAVTFTDRTRADDGTYNTFVRTPTVMVDGDDDPTLAAVQLVAALISPFDGMVLGHTVLDLRI